VQGKRHIISVTLQNEVGALTRVAGMFSTRGYNIESLSVAPTDDPTVSRLTLVTTGSDAVIQQISNQLLKLVDVVDVEDVTREEHFERELLLVKVKAKATQVGKLWSATQKAGGACCGTPPTASPSSSPATRRDQPVRRRDLRVRRGARGGAQWCARHPEGQGNPGVVARLASGQGAKPDVALLQRREGRADLRGTGTGRRVFASTYTCTKRPIAAGSASSLRNRPIR